MPIPVPWDESVTRPAKRRKSERESSKTKQVAPSTNPDKNASVLDGPQALRASPDADEQDESMNAAKAGMDVEEQVKKEEDDVPSLVMGGDSDSALSDLEDIESPAKSAPAKTKRGNAVDKKAAPATQIKTIPKKKDATKEPQFLDPEAEGDEEADEGEIQAALSRPPPVNSEILPLPWKGRLGYVNLRNANLRPLLIYEGLPEHLSTLLKPTRIQLSNLPYCLYPRKPSPTQRSKSATSCNEEQT